MLGVALRLRRVIYIVPCFQNMVCSPNPMGIDMNAQKLETNKHILETSSLFGTTFPVFDRPAVLMGKPALQHTRQPEMCFGELSQFEVCSLAPYWRRSCSTTKNGKKTSNSQCEPSMGSIIRRNCKKAGTMIPCS